MPGAPAPAPYSFSGNGDNPLHTYLAVADGDACRRAERRTADPIKARGAGGDEAGASMSVGIFTSAERHVLSEHSILVLVHGCHALGIKRVPQEFSPITVSAAQG